MWVGDNTTDGVMGCCLPRPLLASRRDAESKTTPG